MVQLDQILPKRKISGSEYQDSVMPGSKPSGNDSCELRGFKPIPIVHFKDSLVSSEKSSELISDLVTLKSKTESSLLTKLEETKVRQELEIAESKHKPWQSMRKSECVSQNQWHIPDVTPKTRKEQKYTPVE
ncbi:dual specificity protein kinase TTK isoform X3 [Sigmodon hispidus]